MQRIHRSGHRSGQQIGRMYHQTIKQLVFILHIRGDTRETTYLTTGLDPNKCIDVSVTSVGTRAETKASTRDVAPVTPLLLASGLLSAATSVDDEMGWETLGLK